MEKFIIFLFSLCLFLAGNASIIEIKEPAILEVSFTQECNIDTTNRESHNISSADMALRIGKTSSMFFPPQGLWYDSLLDANVQLLKELEKKANPPGQANYVSLRGNERVCVFRNIKDGETMVYDPRGGEKSTYTEPTELPQWTIGSETKEVMGYECIKATASYRGREWTAWFTPEIPISEGPWKLAGLPGLVLEAYDRHSDYRFVATRIKTDNLQPVGIYIYASRPFHYKSRTKVLSRKYRDYLQGNYVFRMQSTYGKPGTATGPYRKKYDFLETDYPHED